MNVIIATKTKYTPVSNIPTIPDHTVSSHPLQHFIPSFHEHFVPVFKTGVLFEPPLISAEKEL
jgi:hypothetical protein